MPAEPRDTAATEDLILRAGMAYPDFVKLVSPHIRQSDFSSTSKGAVWRAIVQVADAGGEISDLDVLAAALADSGVKSQSAMVYARRLLGRDPPPFRWVIGHVDRWVRRLRLESSIERALAAVENDHVDDAEGVLRECLSRPPIGSPESGDDLDMAPDDLLRILDDDRRLVAPTRIYALDDLIGGLYREELFLVVSALNVGKSWAALHLAVSALLSARSVLYLTLEMSRDRVHERMLQNVGGLARPGVDLDGLRTLRRKVRLWDEKFRERVDDEAATTADLSEAHRALRVLRSYGGRLSVVEHPSGVCTVGHIERDLRRVQMTHGAPPDLVVIDGLMDMALPQRSRDDRVRHGLTETARELRRIAAEYDCAVVATHQANRQGLKARVIQSEHVGESLGVVQVADTAISLNQTRDEYEDGTMRVHVMRSRNQHKWGMVRVFQALEIGQFALHSVEYDEGDD